MNGSAAERCGSDGGEKQGEPRAQRRASIAITIEQESQDRAFDRQAVVG